MTKQTITFLFLFLSFVAFGQVDRQKLEEALFNLPDVSFKHIPSQSDNEVTYELKVKQPLDHQDKSKGHFYQRVVFTHKGFDRPVIMETNGYDLYPYPSELSYILGANYLNIEHRFFGNSIPDGKPWPYLTLEQVTADLHKINQLFKEIYQGKWISTGVSKGGQTTLFYKYFYPEDVDVAIPYVAPFDYAKEDTRIYDFLDSVGTATCRNKIRTFQLHVLKNKKPILEKLKWYAQGKNLTFDYIGGLEKAFEYAVLEYDFSFWQSQISCDDIPSLQNLDAVVEHFNKVSDISFLDDKTMKKFESHYYQAGTQMGYYGYNIEPFKKYVSFSSNPSAVHMPSSAKNEEFSDTLILKVKNWLETDANNLLYIYGETDTWSATRVTPSVNTNSQSFILPGKGHYEARIKNMSSEMKKDFFNKLQSMSGVVPIKQ
ncbi:S28 family serine protease [Sphingobacterium sp. UT-1RO-CII-1]|uniref:S28 family serine protease n=1 Tax=Sphingobacterium sp. UT-1RO-CII-1 TaxID=2995225 RepID=UPI002279F5E1|nr:S28 family serine protease [Sphingobacterium sp. UT-1RO-CII-1]MCY4778439.1 S28 family serine protease [Sphingobacterium sp. UT-1RO-CII-1]